MFISERTPLTYKNYKYLQLFYYNNACKQVK